ncbi:hypothetical protein K469DRAFT_617145 [Zopfia rhizophila CBS 207.26]|uniref:Hypersensitive response-inducing protein n=1 Tax=Zopfia rhizophila CBS 207.26 TaxID=1314779 RepID=A0A6A6EWT2_9PEZI|nr:hypothetical protein K469DRAFT_617145 [Zopfia rhizophila CBS 207.26]
MLSKISAFALLAATAAAVPAGANSRSAQYSWDVQGFTSTCTAATCRYDFNISGQTGPAGQPSFDATGCIGTSVQGEYKACSKVGIDVPGNVEVQEFNSGRDIGAIISVKYSFEQSGVRYTYTGNNTVAHTNGGGPIGFTIVPIEVYAVPVEA